MPRKQNRNKIVAIYFFIAFEFKKGAGAVLAPAPFRAYFMNLRASFQTKPIEKMITPTITIFAMLAVITPVTFSFMVSTTIPVVEDTDGSTAANAEPPKESRPPTRARTKARTAVFPLDNALVILLIISFYLLILLTNNSSTPTTVPITIPKVRG